jgi:hypothetical protein
MNVMTKLPSYTQEDIVTGCCPVFHPEEYDQKVFDFKDIDFISAKSKTFLHMPLNLGKVMTETQKAIDVNEAALKQQYLILSKDTSAFKTSHLFAVSKEVINHPVVKLSGEYEARVFDGQYQEVPKFMKLLDTEIQNKHKVIEDQWIFYTTCPKCAKVYGHNYMVFFTKTSVKL